MNNIEELHLLYIITRIFIMYACIEIGIHRLNYSEKRKRKCQDIILHTLLATTVVTPFALLHFEYS